MTSRHNDRLLQRLAVVAKSRLIGVALVLLASMATFTSVRSETPRFRTAPTNAIRIEEVSFPSLYRSTINPLRGYVFLPAGTTKPAPAVVMMHGRGGAYSTNANGVYDASTLSRRHRAWGELWARNGYIALMVDDFGPQGYAAGFGPGSHGQRPKELDEVAIRPLHAYGALAYLRTRRDVDPQRIGLMGWSNGGSTTLAALHPDLADKVRGKGRGFRAAIAFYPGCGLKNQFRNGYLPYAPVKLLIGSADAEVSPQLCRKLVQASKSRGGTIDISIYQGAGHGYDQSGQLRATDDDNAGALAQREALEFFKRQLRPGSR